MLHARAWPRVDRGILSLGLAHPVLYQRHAPAGEIATSFRNRTCRQWRLHAPWQPQPDGIPHVSEGRPPRPIVHTRRCDMLVTSWYKAFCMQIAYTAHTALRSVGYVETCVFNSHLRLPPLQVIRSTLTHSARPRPSGYYWHSAQSTTHPPSTGPV